MNMRGILFVLPLCAGLLAGCDNKQEALKFEAARMAALKADDPFLALDSFEQQSGDYGRDCDSLGAFLFGNFASTDKACRARDEATRDMVLKAVEKGSVPALVAGDQRAAGELVNVYRFLKDSRRTYFWEVRSKDVLQLDSRDHLTGDEISAIQKLAADSSRTDI